MVGGRVAGPLHHGHGHGHLGVVRLGDLTGDQVRLVDALLVVTPLLVPDVLVLHGLDQHRLLLAVEPELAVRLDGGLDAVDHAQDAHGGADAAEAAHVVVRAVQLEGAVARVHRLPVHVVELELEDGRHLGAALVLVEHRPVLVLEPEVDGHARQRARHLGLRLGLRPVAAVLVHEGLRVQGRRRGGRRRLPAAARRVGRVLRVRGARHGLHEQQPAPGVARVRVHVALAQLQHGQHQQAPHQQQRQAALHQTTHPATHQASHRQQPTQWQDKCETSGRFPIDRHAFRVHARARLGTPDTCVHPLPPVPKCKCKPTF